MVVSQVWYRVGSSYEPSGITGVSHVLEHMMFKGTKNFGTLDRAKDEELQKDIEAAYQVVLKEEKSRHPDRELIQNKLAEMDMSELVEELRETKHEALNLRFRNATGQLENTAEIKKVRRQIARINTLIREREIAAAEAGE